MSKKPKSQNLQMSLLETQLSEAIEMVNPTILSVEQLNLNIKNLIEEQMGTLWIQGEISNFKPHTSGHYYFSLKDAKAQISAVMFRGHNMKLKFKPHDGLEVLVRGKISVYEPRGTYQILCDSMEPVGAGALQKSFEQLKEKLRLEGLFDSAKKRLIPAHPQHIAVVTSPTGAAIKDILNILQRRAPNIRVTVVPALVQGEAATESLCQSLQLAQKLNDIDVIIIGRGGGSIEDMWCFNSEKLARLIASCRVPIISAVGHEIDFTISDFVADLRAPTPSAAAELVSKSNIEIIEKLKSIDRLLILKVNQLFQKKQAQLKLLSQSLVDPKKKLSDLFLRNDDLLNRLHFAMDNYLIHKHSKLKIMTHKMKSPVEVLQKKQAQLNLLKNKLQNQIQNKLQKKQMSLQRMASLLNSLSPLAVVARGYSLVRQEQVLIKSYKQIDLNKPLHIQLAEGSIEASVINMKD